MLKEARATDAEARATDAALNERTRAADAALYEERRVADAALTDAKLKSVGESAKREALDRLFRVMNTAEYEKSKSALASKAHRESLKKGGSSE